MKKESQDKITILFEQVGEFGLYQLVLFVLVGLISFIPAIVGYSFSFYAATPNYRCQIPSFPNDTYEIQSEYHQTLVDKYIPRSSANSYKDIYDKCRIKNYIDEKKFNLTKCKNWVYSKKYFDKTLVTEVN